MVQTLEMVFRNASGKSVTISLLEPKVDITLIEVNTVMEDIITKNVFSTASGDLVQVVEARIRSNDMEVMV